MLRKYKYLKSKRLRAGGGGMQEMCVKAGIYKANEKNLNRKERTIAKCAKDGSKATA